MTDVYEADRQRILGITRGAEITERVQQDLAIQAAIKIELEQRAAQQRQVEARAAEAMALAQAEAAALEALASLKPLYAQRQELARQAREALASVWRVEQEIRNGLQLADRSLQNVEPLIEPTQRAAWRQALRDRSGLPSQHIYTPDAPPTTEAQAIGVTVVRGITAGVIQPGAIAAGRDVVNL